MKQFYAFLLMAVLSARPIVAQTTDPVRAKLDLIFANLDKSQVPTGRLLEAAVPLAPMLNFDGVVLRDTGRANLDNFRHLYATALSSRLYGTETLPTLPVFNQRVLAAAPAPGGAIPVAVQYIRYARLRPDAESAGLVRLQNEQLNDVPGRTQSPYLTSVLFAAAPERTYAPTNTVSLVFSRALYLPSDAPNTTPALSLDFGDGQGYRPAAWDQPLSTTYATAGTKRVKVKLVYTSGTGAYPADIRESWFDLIVFSVAVANRTTATDLVKVFLPTASGPFRTDYTDHLGAKVTVRFSPNHTSITKPFIVVEGYNTAKIAPHLVGQNNQNNTAEDFFEKITTNPSPFNLYNSLRQADYDIVYIDFTEGTDDIRRNAALFQEVLVWVNQQKQLTGSPQANVVMGESMGGLVARYGLARLVRSGYNPQTRLLVLHDSPQRGANNPIGLQALTRQADFPVAILPGNYSGNSTFIRTSDLSDKLKEALAVLNAPATKQLSLKNVTGTDGQYDDNNFIDGPYKTVVNFADLGGTPAAFPPIIATSDGSQCGRAQNTLPYQELTRNNRDYILGFSYLVRLGVQTEAIANALPPYGTQRTIAHLRVWFTIRVLWATYNTTLLNRDYPSPANTLPYETLPGGTTNLSEQQDLTDNYSRNFIGFWRFANNTSLYNGDLCFVPTYSALDVATVSPATAYAKYINGATDNPSTPGMARYIAQENVNGSGAQYNQAHIRFTARNSAWIFSQLQGTPLPCSAADAECTVPNRITGPNGLCPGRQATFGIQAIPPGASVQWSVTPAGVVTPVGSATGPTFTVFAPASGTGRAVTLQAQVGCGSPLTLLLPVTNGYVDTQLDLQGAQKVCPYTTAIVRVTGVNVQPPYYWTETHYRNGVPGFTGSFTTQTPEYAVSVDEEPVDLTVTATSTCTGANVAAAPRTITPYVDPNGGFYCNPATLRVAPNPADAYVDVSTRPDNAPPAPPQPGHANPHAFQAQLHDGNGRVVGTATTQDGLTRLATTDLPAGLYHLVIQRGQTILRRNLSVQH